MEAHHSIAWKGCEKPLKFLQYSLARPTFEPSLSLIRSRMISATQHSLKQAFHYAGLQ
jgi:hypothetical protein